MFLVHAFQHFMTAYGIYFSYALVVAISIPIAIARTCQALYRHRIPSSWQILLEIGVELGRLVQYVVILAKGTDTALRSLLAFDSAWGNMFSGIRLLVISEALWDFVGFLILFALVNALLSLLLRRSLVESLAEKLAITRFEVPALRSAMLLAIKNLFLIPVSVIYIFGILRFL